MPKPDPLDIIREVKDLRDQNPKLAHSYEQFVESYSKYQEMQRQFKKDDTDASDATTAGIRFLA